MSFYFYHLCAESIILEPLARFGEVSPSPAQSTPSSFKINKQTQVFAVKS